MENMWHPACCKWKQWLCITGSYTQAPGSNATFGWIGDKWDVSKSSSAIPPTYSSGCLQLLLKASHKFNLTPPPPHRSPTSPSASQLSERCLGENEQPKRGYGPPRSCGDLCAPLWTHLFNNIECIPQVPDAFTDLWDARRWQLESCVNTRDTNRWYVNINVCVWVKVKFWKEKGETSSKLADFFFFFSDAVLPAALTE